MNYDIFISYRRTDAEGKISGRDIARLLSKELKLYGYRTFFDYSELKDCDFAQTIIPSIGGCKVFVLVLTKDSLQRCVNEDDWVRREISEALKNKIKIVPVNPDNQFNGWPKDLPPELNDITTIQMSAVDMNSNFELTVKNMVDTRIANAIPPRLSIKKSETRSGDRVAFSIEGKDFSMPDEFLNNDVFEALNRTYGK